ncbi:putative calcineurin superfamily phosphohydrolase [Bacteroides pyogenes JCM 10003]|nr:hypothetical protein [Bacteroides pyogenes]GAE23553.1 putative calcineurin superfamily phosphohydrolase [Bacteroides pyogenes JCM 10003]SUV34396.1 calcineurin superfamily phosphohydrolase [Bacteroides pyogenes]
MKKPLHTLFRRADIQPATGQRTLHTLLHYPDTQPTAGQRTQHTLFRYPGTQPATGRRIRRTPLRYPDTQPTTGRRVLLVLLCCILLAGCDLIDYHPYDVRITGERDVNARNAARIEAACKGKKTIRFVAMGDSQRWYDETEKFVKEINKRDDIDFVIHGGDISDFGLTKEFLWQRDIMNGLKVPYVVLIGNHDCLGTGEEAYRRIFGPTNFAFIAGNVKFVCLNTNALEYDYSEPIPDFDFMEKEWTNRKGEFEKTVVSMHVHPYSDVFNNNVAKVFQYYVTQYPGLQFCTAAHNHSFSDKVPFDDGVHYIVSDCMKNRSYLVFTITPETYEYELVKF